MAKDKLEEPVATYNSISIADVYMGILSHLNISTKLELIEKLKSSIKLSKTSDIQVEDAFNQFSSNWGGDKSASEIAEEIRTSMGNDRTVNAW